MKFPSAVEVHHDQISGREGDPVPAWLIDSWSSLVFQDRVVIDHFF
jgi:hypothetical protein